MVDEIYGIKDTALVEESKEEQEEKAAKQFMIIDLYNKRFDDQDKECIVCLEEQIDTVIMPCRHMCIGINCAKLFQQ